MKTNYFRASIIYFLCFYLIFQPVIAQAGATLPIPGFNPAVATPPPKNALPVLKPGGARIGIAGVDTSTANKLIVLQTKPQAIIDWSSFDIGSDATVHFNQQGNASWTALNRIYNLDPSRIFGKLTADGKVYLINQNGIIFGPGSQINVNTLVASALNIRNDDFIGGSLKFYVDAGGAGSDYPDLALNPNASQAVSNYGQITAANGGSVFLLGPRVENFGSIDAPLGQVGLAAGTLMQLIVPVVDPQISSYQRTATIVNVKDGFGEAVNREGGKLTADSGMAGMYGGVVNQQGLIRSITAVNQKGRIELVAKDKITTGSNSVIESPISTSSDKSVPSTDSDSFGGVLNMNGYFANPDVNNSTPTGLIELNGSIDVPSGAVTLYANDRVFMETGSKINVGGVWNNETADALAIKVQLNSVELADEYMQKDGILKGKAITVNLLAGSSIGNISKSILAQKKTALEQAIKGGTIDINCNSGSSDIIIKQGATLDFSGGGINYSGGLVNSTKLVSGGKIYDISSAPSYLKYDAIIDGSGTYVDAHQQGGDAGSLSLAAGTVVLNGQLNGSAAQGLYQTKWTTFNSKAPEPYLLSVARGLEIPRGGTLTIGKPVTALGQDSLVKEITVSKNTTPLSSYFNSLSPLTTQQTIIGADILNAAKLSNLNLYANTKITTDSDAMINLMPGGNFMATARRIEHSGWVSVPAGKIDLIISDLLPAAGLTGEIFLASGSGLDVAGEKSGSPSAQTGGGSITIQDKTDQGQGVFIQSGAVVDVSGGYKIDPKGKVTGGNAGSLSIQGTNIMLDGDLRGYALADASGAIKGGSITLNSTNIIVEDSKDVPAWGNFTADSEVSPGMKGKLFLAGNRFDDTGFTQITLNSLHDIEIKPNTTISTSLVRWSYPSSSFSLGPNSPLSGLTTGTNFSSSLGPNSPLSGLTTGTNFSSFSQTVSGRPDLIRLDPAVAFMAGSSSFTAAAGKVFEGADPAATDNLISVINNTEKVTVSSGTLLNIAPEGKITLTAPALVDISGTLESLGGIINISTIFGSAGAGDVNIGDGARILANGYFRPGTAPAFAGSGLNYIPRNGGTVNITAAGNLNMAHDSKIDISGTVPVQNIMSLSPLSYMAASDPGTLSLSFQGDLIWNGDVEAKSQMAGVRGGTLIVNKTGKELDISDADIQTYLTAGFDDVTLKSAQTLQLNGPISENIGRKLTLDAPEVKGSGDNTISLQAPWITLANSSTLPATGSPSTGNGDLSLTGQWIDLQGSVKVSGFQDIHLTVARDIRLTDKSYDADNGKWKGQLSVAGNLIMKADRIYPTTNSTYNIYSTGKATILPANNSVGGPTFSAGGNLTVGALGGVEIQGELAAPMGTITLRNYLDDPAASKGGRIYLADGSVVTVAGDASVNYGALDNNNAWTITDKLNKPTTVDGAPEKSIKIEAAGGDAIVSGKAKIDTSGGGSIYAYNWQAAIEGTKNPLTKSGRYVVVSDNSIQLPGDSVYLSGVGGLAAGRYSLLPVEYAFLPGAYIIELQSGSVSLGSVMVTKEGYPVSVGYKSVTDTNIIAKTPQFYSVRPAVDVLAEGNFTVAAITAGDAGDITINGKTTIIDGVLMAQALPKYQGGQISLSALNVIVKQTSGNLLPVGFNFNSGIDPSLQDKLIVSAGSLSGNGFRKVSLGGDEANNIEIEAGAVLDAANISLIANKQTAVDPSITIGQGAKLGVENSAGISGTDEITLATSGSVSIAADAVLHAKNNITLDMNKVDNVVGILGNIKVDQSSITLKSDNIYLGGSGSGKGLSLTADTWNRFTGYQNISLVGRNDIQFGDSFTISSPGSLTLDAQRIIGNITDSDSVILSASTVNIKDSFNHIQNSGSSAAPSLPATNLGTFAVQDSADGQIKVGQINIGNGDVLLGGFKTIALTSNGDVTFKGSTTELDPVNPINSNGTLNIKYQGPGSLTTGNANLQIKAARVTADADKNPDGAYQAANFRVIAGSGKNDLNPAGLITITNSGGASGTSSTPGGTLAFLGKTINNGTDSEKGTIIQVDGGDIKLIATGADLTDGVFLRDGAQILAKGTDAAPGGRVTVKAQSGSIALDAGSVIDVHAGAQGDAGAVTLLAPTGGVSIGGTLSGQASGGAGGSFVLDTHQLSDTGMSNLIGTLTSGGFNQSIDLRSRLGNIDIASGQTLTAKNVKLTADDQSAGNGQINVSGTIDASSAGGTVELYAMNDLSILSGGAVKGGAPANANSNGWSVLMNSAQGSVNVNSGGTVDGGGGNIYLRAQRDGNDVKINLNGSLTGTGAVYAEAFIPHTGSSFSSSWLTEAENYYNANTAVGRLEGSAPAGAATFHLLPGIEWTSTGDITIASLVDLSPSSTNTRYQTPHDISIGKAGEPGVLTIRAEGNLNINNNIVDHPTANTSLSPSSVRDSWGLNLIAGADKTSADYLAVIKGKTDLAGNPIGNLKIANEALIYTESAPIRFATGGDTVIGKGQETPPAYMINAFMTYNLASYDGSIDGHIGRDLKITGGAIQTATGDINIEVGRDLILNKTTLRGVPNTIGAIRTTGWSPMHAYVNGSNAYGWTYTGGGNIRLDVGGNVGAQADASLTTALDKNAWDYFSTSSYNWSANYGANSPKANPTTGLATMGGGDLVVRTGGDFLTQAGTFGQNDQGDLIIYAGGDINGRFLNTNGRAEIHTMGNFGDATAPQVIEAFDSRINVTAPGNIDLATVINPALFAVANLGDKYKALTSVKVGYSENASINLKAGGNVTLGNTDTFHSPIDLSAREANYILPSTLNVEAGGDINIKHNFALLPSPTGNLRLIAGGSIDGTTNDNTLPRAQIFVADMSPADVYNGAAKPAVVDKLFDRNIHAASPLHAADTIPVEISAGQDIKSLELFLPKKAQITAENGDISDLFYFGQNINSDDVSLIKAGKGNIIFSLSGDDTGLTQAGPGSLFIQAGGSILLGNSRGIQTVGGYLNSALGTKGSDLIMLAGYNKYLSAADAKSFFGKLQDEIKSGKLSDQMRLDAAKDPIPLLGDSTGDGNIDMTSSQISTVSGKDNIYIIANGKLDVGKSTFFSSEADRQKTGIFTAGGGAINIFTNGDVNVNESRVITFEGGDITVWSQDKDIKAGRGAKEEVIASPAKLVPLRDRDGNIIGYTPKFTPPAVGSGIRALTFDPDGAIGPLPAPPIGDLFLFAKTIDAGEAGMEGAHIYFNPDASIKNIGNIFSGGVAMPSPGGNTSGIGALSGSGSANQNSQMLSSAAGIRAASASQMLDDVLTKWLDVKVIDFILNDSDDSDKYKKCILNGGTEEDCANK